MEDFVRPKTPLIRQCFREHNSVNFSDHSTEWLESPSTTMKKNAAQYSWSANFGNFSNKEEAASSSSCGGSLSSFTVKHANYVIFFKVNVKFIFFSVPRPITPVVERWAEDLQNLYLGRKSSTKLLKRWGLSTFVFKEPFWRWKVLPLLKKLLRVRERDHLDFTVHLIFKSLSLLGYQLDLTSPHARCRLGDAFVSRLS